MKTRAILRILSAFTIFVLLLSIGAAYSTAQETPPSLLPQTRIREVTSRILKKADKANCKSTDCRIVVADFTFSSGLTSQLGIELADQFSKELASQRNATQIIDRSQLHSVFEQQRIPGALLNNEKAMRWLGQTVGATSILTGTIEDGGSAVRVRVRLLSCWNDKAGPEESITFPYAGPTSDLSRKQAFAQQPPSTSMSSDPSIARAGKSGVTQPSCIYCPNPNYTDPARRARLSGRVVMDVIVSPEGQVVQDRILRGLPFGLNEASMDAVRTWKFRPAMLNGKPIPVMVAIEVTFRLN
jgi:TonB family protein